MRQKTSGACLWPPRRHGWPQHPYHYVFFVCICVALYTLLNYTAFFIPRSGGASELHPQCAHDARHRPPSLSKLPAQEKYLFYSPHSGFSNQVGELKNALLIAALLNRTLILPPIFDHHAVALGSCPKFRVREPHEMRASAWAHITDLINGGKYLAIADVVDLSTVVSSNLVKTIDLRIFISLWCGADVALACSGPLCTKVVSSSSPWGTLDKCGALLSRPELVQRNCVYAVNDDCRTTIWMHGLEASEIPPTNMTINSGRTGKLAYKKRYKDIVEALGPGSEAANYAVLSFGSLFSSEYKGAQLHVDMHSSTDRTTMAIKDRVKFILFTPTIRNAGSLFVKERVRRPFFCAQLRLLDGQFKNHWKKTFMGLRSELEAVRERQGPGAVLPIFVMTDLPRSNWTGTYLGDLAASTSVYELHFVEDEESLILETGRKLMKEDYGLRSGFFPEQTMQHGSVRSVKGSRFIPDILLYIQEVICSCATLGFVGTSGSTLTDSILQLRKANTCGTT